VVLLLGLTFQVRSGFETHPFFALFTPILEGVQFVIKGIRDTVEDYTLLVNTEARNRMLQVRLQHLELEQRGLLQLADENKRLRALLKLKEALQCRVTGAGVIARDPTASFDTLTINKGSDDGISVDMAVIGTSGLLGRTFAVSDSAAKVLLITDLKASTAVYMAPTQEQSIMDGNGDATCTLKYVHKDTPVHVGDWVYTSGLDRLYPRGIPVGQVSSAKQLDYGIFQQVGLLPAERVNRVEQVLVVLEGNSCEGGYLGEGR